MALKEKWKKTGKNTGKAFGNFGQALGKTMKVVFANDDNMIEANGHKEVANAWRKTGKSFGQAGKAWGKSAKGTLDKVIGEEEIDNPFIACCGLDCEKCEARIATVTNDDNLRKEVAEKWSKLNNVEIAPEMINCEGCRLDGKKTPFCDKLCPIRQCVLKKRYETCAGCEELLTCEKIKMIIDHNKEAFDNLKNK